jgi:DNA-binding CsgD family transcriptional regulator
MLEVLGVDRRGEEAYLALIDRNVLSPDEILAATAIEREVLSGVLHRLEDRGLICRVPGRPTRYAALPPDAAIEVLLLARERDLTRVRSLAHRLGERHRRARSGTEATTLIEVISGEYGVARCGQQLLRRARHTIRGIDAPLYVQTIESNAGPSAADVVEPGVRRRFIHDRAALRQAGRARRIEHEMASGEEVRILADVPMKMILADDDAGLIPLSASPQVLDSCVLVHPSALLDALSSLFETFWGQAQPFLGGATALEPAADEAGAGPADPPLRVEEQRIVSLLALGLSDEAIARQLAIGHRTVQRRIQALMVRLGATSRFQAGILAARRGWWDPSPRI